MTQWLTDWKLLPTKRYIDFQAIGTFHVNNLKTQQSFPNLYFKIFQRKQKSNCFESDVKVATDKILSVHPSESFCTEKPDHFIRTNRIVHMKVFLSSFNPNNARTLIKISFFCEFCMGSSHYEYDIHEKFS